MTAAGGIGNGTFNTPVLVEAADTAPFFHNNSIATIEGAVDFYDSAAFNASPSAAFIGGIQLEATEVAAVAAFLRTINALENIRSSVDLGQRAKLVANGQEGYSQARQLLHLSIAELDDAIEVLNGAGLNPIAVRRLRSALALDTEAADTPSRIQRNQLIDQAAIQKYAARADLVN
jgi:hypothetical protein